MILTIPGPYTRWVVRELSGRVSIAGILIEECGSKDPREVSFQSRVIRRVRALLRSPVEKPEEEARRIFRQLKDEALERFSARVGGGAKGWPEGIPRCVTGDPNDEESLSWCRKIEPDLVLVLGASILKPAFLRIPSMMTMNAHPSLLPDFRGQFAEFWQVYFDRTDRSGITIHEVDQGVDTGDILLQRPLDLPERTDPFEIQARCALLLPDALEETLVLIRNGKLQPRPQGRSAGRCFRARDLKAEHVVELLRKLGRLPVEAGASVPEGAGTLSQSSDSPIRSSCTLKEGGIVSHER